MSKRIGNIIILEPEDDRECQFCSKRVECRPFGPNGEDICYDCATATPEMKAAVDKRMSQVLFGEKE